MGLSRDVTMGEDLTTNCVVRGNGAVDIVTGEVTSSRVTRDTVNSLTTSHIITCNTVSDLVCAIHFTPLLFIFHCDGSKIIHNHGEGPY